MIEQTLSKIRNPLSDTSIYRGLDYKQPGQTWAILRYKQMPFNYLKIQNQPIYFPVLGLFNITQLIL